MDEDEYLLELYSFFDNVTLEEKERHINRFKNLTFDPNIFKTDLHESFCNNQSSYYTEELLNQYQSSNSKNNMSMLNANIRSLNKNVDSFKDFINTSTMQFGSLVLLKLGSKTNPWIISISVDIIKNFRIVLREEAVVCVCTLRMILNTRYEMIFNRSNILIMLKVFL